MEDVPLDPSSHQVKLSSEENPSGPAAATQPTKRPQSTASPAASNPPGPNAPAEPAPRPPLVAEQPRSPPPATHALASVLGFFSSSAVSSDKQAQTQPAVAGGAAAVNPQAGVPPAAQQQGAPGAQQQQQEGEFDAVAAFEAEALEAADKVAQAAEEMGQKLLHGAAEAKDSLASLAQGLSSWWSTLDPTKPAGQGGSSGSGSGGQRGRPGSRAGDLAAAAEQLGLNAGETVLESFACALWQTYTSTNNFFTPVRQVPFPGSLHITSQRLCFAFDDRAVAPIRLPGTAVKGVAKLAADAQQGLPERLELGLEGSGQSLVLAEFALGGLEMDSALALVEHLAEGGDT